jgi:WhiB family redox-sensing transcriptional regulator
MRTQNNVDVEFIGINLPEFSSRQKPLCADADPELFYPIEVESRLSARGTVVSAKYLDERAAKKICNQCPLQMACLKYALENSEYGIWGGTSETERANLRRRIRRN